VALVAGACLDFNPLPHVWVLVAVVLAARLLAEVLRGLLLVGLVPAARPAGPRIGLGMASTGAISLALAYTLTVRLPGVASSAVLLLAAAGVLLGELIGPAELRRALERAGETQAVQPEAEVAPLSLPSSALHPSDYPDPQRRSDYPEGP
jgi:hypothetical protein